MQIPPRPGVYVVELLNEEPISVNADRPAIAERCIKVTHANCKYGKAVDLARRQRDYHKTFGPQNVRFRFFALTEHYSAVEAMVGQRLARYRIAGASGRSNEWLQGIPACEVEEVVKSVLATLQLNSNTGMPPKQSPMASSKQSDPLGVSPADLLDAADYLEQQGMPLSLLRELHHSPRRDETFASTRRYFGNRTNVNLNNQLYGARLIFVASEFQSSGRTFEDLVYEALQRHPK